MEKVIHIFRRELTLSSYGIQTFQPIGGRMVERLREAGFDPAGLAVAVGPAIGPCCFAIGGDVEDELRQAFPAAHDAIRTDEQGRRVADLWELNVRSLLDAGVPADRIDVVRRCTACEASEFFSHRRDAGQGGRQSGLISPARGAPPLF